MAEADVLNHLRNSYEYPHPTRKQVVHFLTTAKTAAERKVWRDLLNSEAFHKSKIKVKETRVSKKVDKAVKSKEKRK